MLDYKVIMKKTPDVEEELNTNIVELTATVRRINSLKFVFFRGIINGVGTFIGATVVAAIAITALVQILNLLNIDLGIKEYLDSLIVK